MLNDRKKILLDNKKKILKKQTCKSIVEQNKHICYMKID